MRTLQRAVLPLLAVLMTFMCQSVAGAAPAHLQQPGPLEARGRAAFKEAMVAVGDGMQSAVQIAVARGELVICPVPGSTFVDSWHAPRDGHLHQGVDMMAPEGTRVLAPESGTYDGQGESFWLRGDSGTSYFGTHNSGDIAPDGRVTAGQPVALVSNTGNAAGGAPHLHFEIHPGGGPAVNPYPAVLAACSAPLERAMAAPPGQGGPPTAGGCYARFDSWRWLDCWHRGHGHRHPASWLQGQWRALLRYLGASSSASSSTGSLVWHWQLVANCESSDNPAAHSPSGTYHGWLQFSLSTWQAYGGQGDPHTQSREAQAAVAERVRTQGQGLGAWPHCGAYYR